MAKYRRFDAKALLSVTQIAPQSEEVDATSAYDHVSSAVSAKAAKVPNVESGRPEPSKSAERVVRKALPGELPTNRVENTDILATTATFQRSWAASLARINSGDPLRGVPPPRWRQFLEDASVFVRSSWDKQAAALGWTPIDLVGCDRKKPFARIDRLGLIWLLNGDKVVALSTDTAVIESATSSRLTYHRRRHNVGEIVLPWELVRSGHPVLQTEEA